MVLIIITWFPWTWKTTLGKTLSNELRLPFISKDDFKEILFDNLWIQDLDWSKNLWIASYWILYHITESFLKVEKSLIVETNFHPILSTEKFCELKSKYGCHILQIRCFCDWEILLERFRNRMNSHERHPWHTDDLNIRSPILLKWKIEALNLEGELFDIDTTFFDKIDYVKLCNDIKLSITNFWQ